MGKLLLGYDCSQDATLNSAQLDRVALPRAHVAYHKNLTPTPDAVIDFSVPSHTPKLAEYCAHRQLPLVVGTTGLDSAAHAALKAAARRLPLCYSANFSVGITLLARAIELTTKAARGFDIEINDIHHRHKRDLPSGTALLLGRAAAKGAGIDFERSIFSRPHGVHEPRPDQVLGFSAMRGGGARGEHEVLLLGEDEIISFGHRALSRSIFAAGALRAACWLVDKHRASPNDAKGLYTMDNVLGLNP